MKKWTWVALSSVLLSLLFLLTILLNAEAQNETSTSLRIFPPNSHPYNKTYGEWSAKWWQWAVSQPKDKSPLNDPTGINCGVAQNDTNMWFLAGTSGGGAVRTCHIPAGKAVMFPVVNVRCDYKVDPSAKNEDDLRRCAKEDQDTVNTLQATIDGKPVTNLKDFRMQSPLFNITFPQDNVASVTPGTTQAMSDGFWVILKPLPVGQHRIYSNGGLINPNPESTEANFSTETSFNIIVD